MTDLKQSALPLGALVEIVSGARVGQQGMVVDRRLVPVEGAFGRQIWQYSLWIDGPGEEFIARHDELCER